MTGVFDLRIESRAHHDLEVVSFRGRERLSRTYVFEVLLRGRETDTRAVVRDLLGTRAHLRVGGEEGRTIHGILRRVEAESTSGGGDGVHVYRATLAPRIWLLGRRKNSRIFQNLTVREIVDRLLDERGIERRWALAGAYMPRVYCVQYEETDLRFLERILAEEGMFFRFDHPASGPEEMVISDSRDLVPPLSPDDRFVFRDSRGMEATAYEVHRFRVSRRVRSGSAFLRDFDFLRPSRDLSAVAARAAEEIAGEASGGFDESSLEVYDHHGEFFGFGVDTAAAELHLAQLRRRAVMAEGESRSFHVAPGHTLSLTGAPLSDQDGRYAIVGVEHEGVVPERADRQAPFVYKNRFDAVPERVAFRPKRPERKLQQVLETATVVGPAGHEIHTDEHGRIKVQFHWDREGRRDERSSCWMRTMQPWSGAGWGFQFIPRIGMEVLVMFIGGDVDKPIVVGSVPNAEHPMPFPLPQNKTKSGVRTQTTLGGNGHNELSFEDRRRHEEVFLRAQRNLTELVLHDHTTTVQNSQTTRVAGQQSDIVGGNRSEIVSQNRWSDIHGNDVTQVNGTRSVTVEDNQRTVVRGNDTLEVEGTMSVSAGQRTSVTRKDEGSVVGGHRSRVVSRDATEVIGGALHVTTGGEMTANHGGRVEVRSGETVTFTAKKKMIFQCGSSSIVMTEDGISVLAGTVSIGAGSKVEIRGDGAELSLTADITALGDSVSVSSSGAELTLDSKATLKGSQVALKGGGGGSGSKDQGSSSDAAPPPKLELSVFVGHDPSRDGKALVIRGADGAEISRIAASGAKSSTDRFLVFEVDPAEHEGQIEIVWETPEGTTHVAGPMDAREVRDALVAKNVRQASERMRKRSPSTEHFSYTKDELPSPEPARGRQERLPIGGPGALTAATTWLAPAGTRIDPEDLIENAIQALKEGGR